MKLSNEAKVGVLVFATAIIGVAFAWMIGVQNPFKKTVDFYVTYNFAGGVEVGSPVRVSGIKVGKVKEIDFFVPANLKKVALKEPGSAPSDEEVQEIVPVRLRVSVLERAAKGIRRDSRFYINLAGLIGERYIEITPGSKDSSPIEAGQVVAGVDPPRIDQLISQSFDLAGKVTSLLEKNKGEITKTINTLYKLSVNFNKTVEAIEKSKVFKTEIGRLINNLISITTDVEKITKNIRTPEGEKTLKLLHQLLWRLEPLDSKTIKDFFQEEGIRARIF